MTVRPGMSVAWIGKGGAILQGRVERTMSTGGVLVKRRGEYQAGTVLPPERLYPGIAEAMRHLTKEEGK